MIALHADVLGERARLTPEKTALVYVPTGERLTYRQLDERAARMARFLADPSGLALSKGDRAGLLAGNSIEFLEVFFGAIKAGVVVVPLGTRLTPREVAHVVADSGMAALLYGPEHAETVRGLPADAAGGLARRSLLAPGERAAEGDLSWPEERARYGAAGFARTPCGAEDLCALLYTSGTTGRPKGVMVPHRMVAWNAVDTALSWQLREEDVSPIFTPLYHAGGLGAFLVPILAIGGTVVLHAQFDAEEIWRTVARERCTVVLGVPTIWKLLAEAPSFAEADLSSVRWLISGGAPLPLFVIETYQRRGVAFKQGYGLTEVGVNCFSMTVEESAGKKGSIGKPLLWTEARLVDEAGNEVGGDDPAAVGELCLRGPHVCLGYWRNREATRAALDDDGWFHTGDLARRDAEGFFTIAGRRKDMLISGGVNVYPAEIEGELLLCPGVADAAVVGVPHETWGESGVAFVVRQEGEAGASLSAGSLARFLEERLARYKVPRDFVFVDALPRTAYGKVVKGELRDRWVRERGGA